MKSKQRILKTECAKNLLFSFWMTHLNVCLLLLNITTNACYLDYSAVVFYFIRMSLRAKWAGNFIKSSDFVLRGRSVSEPLKGILRGWHLNFDYRVPLKFEYCPFRLMEGENKHVLWIWLVVLDFSLKLDSAWFRNLSLNSRDFV